MSNCACDNVSTIPGLPLTAGLAIDTLFEICSTPGATPTSQRVTGQQLLNFISVALPSLSIAGGALTVDSDGNLVTGAGISFAGGAGTLNNDGSVSFATGSFTVDLFGSVTGASFLIPGMVAINSDGSASFGGGTSSITSNGTIVFGGGTGQLNNNGSASFGSGACNINADGTASFANGNFNILGSGEVTCTSFLIPGAAQIFSDGSATFAAGQILFNGDGSVSFANGAVGFDSTGSLTTPIRGFCVITQDTTSPATFNTNGQNETIYDDSGSVITNLTINLPATTVSGQELRYVSKAGATIVTVSGTVTVGTAITTLAANASVAWQAVDGAGTFIRIQ